MTGAAWPAVSTCAPAGCIAGPALPAGEPGAATGTAGHTGTQGCAAGNTLTDDDHDVRDSHGNHDSHGGLLLASVQPS